MRCVLGIDAGGTKTVCLAADLDGRVVSRAAGPGANLKTAGELGVEKVLHQVIEDALAGRDAVPVAMCLGMAGADRASDRDVVGGIVRRIGHRTRALIVNDALIALVAGAGDEPGVVMLAGTGSIAYGRDRQGRAARAGGWGHVLGDEGSGYWIGRHALAAVVRDADGRGRPTRLTAALVARLGISQAGDLVRVVYEREMTASEVAALAPLVFAAHAAGDEIAAEILERAADELALGAASVIARLDLGGASFPLLMAGGVLANSAWLRAAVSGRVVATSPGARPRLLERDPALGAIHLALAEARGGSRLPTYRPLTGGNTD